MQLRLYMHVLIDFQKTLNMLEVAKKYDLTVSQVLDIIRDYNVKR